MIYRRLFRRRMRWFNVEVYSLKPDLEPLLTDS